MRGDAKTEEDKSPIDEASLRFSIGEGDGRKSSDAGARRDPCGVLRGKHFNAIGRPVGRPGEASGTGGSKRASKLAKKTRKGVCVYIPSAGVI